MDGVSQVGDLDVDSISATNDVLCRVSWNIPSFSSCRRENKVVSGEFGFAFHKWRLLMYPVGNYSTPPPSKRGRHLGLFVKVLDLLSPKSVLQARFRFILVHPTDHSLSRVLACNHSFTTKEDDRGWNEVLPLYALHNSSFLQNDRLLIRVQLERMNESESTDQNGRTGILSGLDLLDSVEDFGFSGLGMDPVALLRRGEGEEDTEVLDDERDGLVDGVSGHGLREVAAAAAKAAAESIDNANLAARAAQDAKVSKAVRKVQAKHDGEGKRRNGSFPPPPLPPNDASFQRDEAPSTGGDASQGQAGETVPKQRHDSRTAVTKQANKTAPSAKRKTSGGERALVDDQEDFGTGDDNEAKTRAQIAALGGLTGLTEQQLGMAGIHVLGGMGTMGLDGLGMGLVVAGLRGDAIPQNTVNQGALGGGGTGGTEGAAPHALAERLLLANRAQQELFDMLHEEEADKKKRNKKKAKKQAAKAKKKALQAERAEETAKQARLAAKQDDKAANHCTPSEDAPTQEDSVAGSGREAPAKCDAEKDTKKERNSAALKKEEELKKLEKEKRKKEEKKRLDDKKKKEKEAAREAAKERERKNKEEQAKAEAENIKKEKSSPVLDFSDEWAMSKAEKDALETTSSRRSRRSRASRKQNQKGNQQAQFEKQARQPQQQRGPAKMNAEETASAAAALAVAQAAEEEEKKLAAAAEQSQQLPGWVESKSRQQNKKNKKGDTLQQQQQQQPLQQQQYYTGRSQPQPHPGTATSKHTVQQQQQQQQYSRGQQPHSQPKATRQVFQQPTRHAGFPSAMAAPFPRRPSSGRGGLVQQLGQADQAGARGQMNNQLGLPPAPLSRSSTVPGRGMHSNGQPLAFLGPTPSPPTSRNPSAPSSVHSTPRVAPHGTPPMLPSTAIPSPSLNAKAAPFSSSSSSSITTPMGGGLGPSLGMQRPGFSPSLNPIGQPSPIFTAPSLNNRGFSPSLSPLDLSDPERPVTFGLQNARKSAPFSSPFSTGDLSHATPPMPQPVSSPPLPTANEARSQPSRQPGRQASSSISSADGAASSYGIWGHSAHAAGGPLSGGFSGGGLGSNLGLGLGGGGFGQQGGGAQGMVGQGRPSGLSSTEGEVGVFSRFGGATHQPFAPMGGGGINLRSDIANDWDEKSRNLPSGATPGLGIGSGHASGSTNRDKDGDDEGLDLQMLLNEISETVRSPGL